MIFWKILLAQVLTDFVFQPDPLAENKEKVTVLFVHRLIFFSFLWSSFYQPFLIRRSSLLSCLHHFMVSLTTSKIWSKDALEKVFGSTFLGTRRFMYWESEQSSSFWIRRPYMLGLMFYHPTGQNLLYFFLVPSLFSLYSEEASSPESCAGGFWEVWIQRRNRGLKGQGGILESYKGVWF